MRSFVTRVLAIVALVVGSTLPVLPAQAAPDSLVPAPTELTFACALKSNGQMRWVQSLSSCSKKDTRVTVKPGPTRVCIQPSGSTRYVTSFSGCRPPATALTLPPTSGTVYFCAAAGSGVLRFVTDPSLCLAGETPLQATPNDAAPTLSSSLPATGSTSVATTAVVQLTFSEAVTAPAGAFAFTCGVTPVAFALSGAPGAVLTLTPMTPLQEGTSCSVTVLGGSVSDVDAIDPPDVMATNPVVTFTTDAAPTLVSSTPADGATDVAVGADVVLTFSEPVAVPAAALDLVCAASPVGFTVEDSGTSTITVNPAAALPASAGCLLTVTGSAVSDVDGGDPPDAMAGTATVGFTTADEAPTVVSTTPADGATGVGTSAGLSVTFSEPVTATSDAFTLTCGGTPVAVSADAGPATTFAVTPGGPLPTGVTCTFTVVGAEVADVDTVDPPNVVDGNTAVTFETATNNAPTAVDLTPRVVAENSPSGTTVGALSTTDADAGDTFTYTLVPGAGSTDNALFAVVGTSLQTAAGLDAEDGSRSVRVRSTDAAGDWVEAAFTITVTDVNEAPTDVTLTNSSVDENEPAGTAVGTLGGSDPDAGQTLTFALATNGCGSTYPGSASFAVDGTTLETAASLNHEVTPTIKVCVRATDSASPGLSLDEAFTITVADVNDAPTTAPDEYLGAVGNTMFALNLPGTPAPRVAVTGAVLTANDLDEDGDTLRTVAETVASTGGGTATIDAAGNFTFLPGVGDKGQTDSFAYTVTDGTAQATGTVTVTIGATVVWWVDNASSSASPDGRSTSPLTSTQALNGPDATDVDSAGDHIFVFTGTATYQGGLRLEPNQTVLSSRTAITVGPDALVAPGATSPVLTNAAGNGIDLASGTSVSGIDVSGASGDGVNGVGVSTTSVGVGAPMTISGSGEDGFDLSGAGSGAVTIGASITTSGARSLAVSGRTGSTVTVSGAITGKGVALSSNTGATISLSGALALTTTTTPAFSATGGGTVSTSGSPNAASATSGGAVIVENTTIGAPGLTFRSVSANGAVNGIRLVNTGATAGLTVTGGGSVAQGGDVSGGTITATSGPGILLTNTRNPSFNNVSVTNVGTAAGVKGTGVTGFGFSNGRVDGSGLGGADNASANLAFNTVSAGVSNLSGVVSVTNSVLANAYGSGIDIYNESGTISSLTVSGNVVQSSTSTTTSKGHGVIVQSLGSAGGASAVTAAAIANNRVLNFPSGGGILLYGGNVAGASATILGANAGSKVVISGNVVRGASDGTPMNTNCIYVSVAGYGTGFVDVQNNGTVGEPLGANRGNCISVNSTGAATLTSLVSSNRVAPGAGQIGGAFGIAGGAAKQTVVGPTDLNSAVLNLTVDGNAVSATKSSGISLLTRDSGTLRSRVQNNNVAAPVELAGESGIVVTSGDQIAGDATVCLQILNNSTAGSVNSVAGGTAPGIGLFKRGTVQTTNDFGVSGLTATPTSAADVVTYVSSVNSGSALGSGIYGTFRAQVSGNNYVPCTLPF
ncbi:MAG TPA: Ig-like domain-containing protein [Ornithinibacter sp.]|nr:Ig-like domain-containing protein [Ornithinibacter sp.]